ncbi:protein FAM32A-like [Sylvia atricapilla]|uniref:protein FAM32A-like n=1 Tax=Sylvia atricapilla TaxID=48155 RepID=UPI003399EB9C
MERGPLRLKGSRGALGASKRTVKDKAQILEQIISNKKQQQEKCGLDKQIWAQVAFEKMQEKQQVEWVLKKTSQTHKQCVEELNRHLDVLTEH